MRTYSTIHQQINWLQQFQWHNIWVSHGPELLTRRDEQGLYVFPTHCLEWDWNKAKLLQFNTQQNYPVAKLKAADNGRHAQKADSNKARGLIPLLYLCRDRKVMWVVNLKAEWGLYNGAVGTLSTKMVADPLTILHHFLMLCLCGLLGRRVHLLSTKILCLCQLYLLYL